MIATIRNIASEVRRGDRFARGRTRWTMDVIAYRAMRLGLMRPSPRTRSVTLHGGAAIEYRRNRGDIESIREVVLDEVYALPDVGPVRRILDLGANIGVTSVWMWAVHRPESIVAVEPVPELAALCTRNFRANGVVGEVVAAAVGPTAGVAMFETASTSNRGHLSTRGDLEVPVVTPRALVERLGGAPDLVKMDIEGGEQQLLDGDLSWLDGTAAIAVEFHPDVVDVGRCVQRLTARGFNYHRHGTLAAVNLFLR